MSIKVLISTVVSILLAHGISPVRAQQLPPVDSLIDQYLLHGMSSSWQPWQLFEGCPRLAEWQHHGIRRLMAADLTLERTNDLARAWSRPLRNCGDSTLEQWYLARLDAAIGRGEWARALAVRTAIYNADSPRIRDYLRTQMLDASLHEPVRSTAGVFYFMRFERDELVREFLDAFETMQMPARVGWGQAERLMDQNPDLLLQGLSDLVRVNPMLADQPAFAQVVEGNRGRASENARRNLGEALQAGLVARAGAIADSRRERLESSVRFLRRPMH